MRITSSSIAAALAVALACGCKSKEAKPGESKAAGTVSADELGTFTCTTIKDEAAAGSNSACVSSAEHFDPSVPVVHLTYRTRDLPKAGDTYAIQWIATDVGHTAPANTVIATVDKTVEALPAATASYTLNSYLTKPTNGWPVGTYRVEVKLGDKVVTSAPFAIQ